MRFEPLYDRILAKRVELDTETAGGLFIPEAAREKAQEGVVIAIGRGHRVPGTRNDDGKPVCTPMDVLLGDRILFGKYAGTEITVDGEEHVILREDEILGIMREGKLDPEHYMAPTP